MKRRSPIDAVNASSTLGRLDPMKRRERPRRLHAERGERRDGIPPVARDGR